jgi:GH15 family glucan-1,4-alpha-glucosidase
MSVEPREAPSIETSSVMPTPPLDHGVIGNGRVLALVSPSSAIDWLCMPSFSSPSVFARLLDTEKGGTFMVVSGDGRELRGELDYIRNTNVLITRFQDGDDIFDVVDFAPRVPDGIDVRVPIEIVRLIQPVKGRPRLKILFDPRPDYGRAPVHLAPGTNGVDVIAGEAPLRLSTNLPCPYILSGRAFVLNGPVFFVLTYGRRDEQPTLASVNHDLDLTIQGWRAWSKTCALPLFAEEEVLRSALCLKLHAYHDTGAIIAATTTSIPETMGTERTWDYRYCWIRDAAFVVEALRRLSHLNEGEQFLRFVRDAAETGPLQPLYGIDGRRDLEEVFLPHLKGFGGNGFVRIGNAAAIQSQNDLFGEVILCLQTLLQDPRIVNRDPDAYVPLIRRLVEEAIRVAPIHDMGIWEYRTILKPHTFSRAMCWVAVSRGALLVRQLGYPDLASEWDAIARREQDLVLERGFNKELGYFTQSLDGRWPDASNLLLATVGIVDPRDPRFVSTVEAYDTRLNMGDGLMLRYANPDDFGVPSSAFTICSFWMAEALALIGRLDDAAVRFKSLMKYANPVGLFSEDIDPRTGALLGNFPQAYTHVGLIHAAITIGELLEARDGRVRAWV